MEADVAIYVFWAWLAVSAVLVAVQLVRRARFRRTMRRREEEVTAARVASRLSLDAPKIDPAPLAPPSEPVAEPVTTPVPEAAEPLLPVAGPEAVSEDEASLHGAEVIDLEREAMIDAEPTRATTAHLGDLLTGVSLPHGLLPGDAAGDDALRLATDDADAAEVGTALADELERCGYTIAPIGDDRAEARRGDEVLSMQIRPLDDGTEVDLWSGSGANPLLDGQRC